MKLSIAINRQNDFLKTWQWSISRWETGEVIAAGWNCKDYATAQHIARETKWVLIKHGTNGGLVKVK